MVRSAEDGRSQQIVGFNVVSLIRVECNRESAVVSQIRLKRNRESAVVSLDRVERSL